MTHTTSNKQSIFLDQTGLSLGSVSNKGVTSPIMMMACMCCCCCTC